MKKTELTDKINVTEHNEGAIENILFGLMLRKNLLDGTNRKNNEKIKCLNHIGVYRDVA